MEKIKYTIREFREEDLNPDKGFLETLSNLSKTARLSQRKIKEVFREIRQKENSYIFVAVGKNKQIIGTIKLMIERKFYHEGAKAGHIEDVVVRKGFEKMGIASSLIRKAVAKAKELECYKVILDCRDELIPFYKKFNFYKFENCLRIDFKK
ncbi:MAG: GNAT family N-acetyltransferase [Patescibacteria group bacterium]